MKYPRIIVLPGTDIKHVINILNSANVEYTIINVDAQNYPNIKVDAESKLSIELNTITYLDKEKFVILENIQKGLTLPFFNPEFVKLKWTIFPNWYLLNKNPPKINIESDIKEWFAKDIFTNDERLTIINIVNNYIEWDSNILSLYRDTLLPVFQHPDIHAVLSKCALRKEGHVNMWLYLKAKFKIPGIVKKIVYPLSNPPTTLCETAFVLAQLMVEEAILRPASVKKFTDFISQGCGNMGKFVKRRDKESQQHNKIIKILFTQFEIMYPFLGDYIAYLFELYHSPVSRNANSDQPTAIIDAILLAQFEARYPHIKQNTSIMNV